MMFLDKDFILILHTQPVANVTANTMATVKKKENAIESFDDILDHVGGWNRYQAILLVIRY